MVASEEERINHPRVFGNNKANRPKNNGFRNDAQKKKKRNEQSE